MNRPSRPFCMPKMKETDFMESAQTTGRLTLVGTPIGNLSDFSPAR